MALQVISRPRAAGKTTDIVKTAIANKWRIWVFNAVEKDRLYCTFPDLKPGQVVTTEEVRSGKAKGDRNFFGMSVDNADFVLEQLAGENIRQISVNGMEEK